MSSSDFWITVKNSEKSNDGIKVSFKPFTSQKYVIEFYIDALKESLHCSVRKLVDRKRIECNPLVIFNGLFRIKPADMI